MKALVLWSALVASCAPPAAPAESAPPAAPSAVVLAPPSAPTPAPVPTASAAPVVEAPSEASESVAEPVDPALLERLSVVARKPKRLARLGEARKLYDAVVNGLRAGSWQEEKRVRCGERIEGAALVTDAQGKLRAFTLLGGTEDSYQELRFFFDEAERLRILFVNRADVEDGSSQQLVHFDPGGAVVACDKLVEKIGLPIADLCEDQNPPPKLDKEVARAVGNRPHKPRNRYREDLQALDARSTFEQCAPP